MRKRKGEPTSKKTQVGRIAWLSSFILLPPTNYQANVITKKHSENTDHHKAQSVTYAQTT